MKDQDPSPTPIPMLAQVPMPVPTPVPVAQVPVPVAQVPVPMLAQVPVQVSMSTVHTRISGWLTDSDSDDSDDNDDSSVDNQHTYKYQLDIGAIRFQIDFDVMKQLNSGRYGRDIVRVKVSELGDFDGLIKGVAGLSTHIKN